MVLDFKQRVKRIDSQLLRVNKLQTLQVNLGNICNQKCQHCHVQAGPEGQNVMSRQVMTKVLDFLLNRPGLAIDLTGGCPELNPDFRFFLDNAHTLAARLMVRTNLTVLFEPGLDWVPEWFREHRVVLIASLPCYTEQNVDNQRGNGIFKKSIAALKMLNDLGYGLDSQLELNLVYNPGDDFLPGPQQQLEEDYKRVLSEKYNICFNKLFTITNVPIGRFRQYLEANGRLKQYLQLLEQNFNPDAAEAIMCRNLVTIDYQGLVYNCDFNQALGLAVVDEMGNEVTIERLDELLSHGFEIITGEHCYCCTAGAGSSCTGCLVK